MGLGVAALFWLVFCLSGGELCAAQDPPSHAGVDGAGGQIPDLSTPSDAGEGNPGPSAPSLPSPSGAPAAEPLGVDERDPVRPTAGTDPTGPVEDQKKARPRMALNQVPVSFEQPVPVPAHSITVRCGEGSAEVAVKQNFLGNGQLINPADLTLGGCAANGTADHVVQFNTELQGCGSKMGMTDSALIYTFSLVYTPTPIRDTLVIKTNPVEVVIQCHYRRKQLVHSDALMPTWMPYASSKFVEQQLLFSLRLMTGDWQSERPSSVYSVSDVMHIEASVLQTHHAPLRVHVDSCVATPEPDPSSLPAYRFIANHGCLTDSKLTGAKSYFMHRTQEDKLRFQLQTFRFRQDERNTIYITCHLKATTVSMPISLEHKACSYLTEAKRWVASGGDNQVCSCCESSCGSQRRRRSLAADADSQWEVEAALGPIVVRDGERVDKPVQITVFPAELAYLVQKRELSRAVGSPGSLVLLCSAGAALAVALLVVTAAVVCGRPRKLSKYAVCT